MSVYFEPAHYARPSFGGQFGAGLGQGLSQGIGMALQDMFEQKQQQRQMMKQRAVNEQSASSLADSFGLRGKEKKSIMDLLSNITPDKQVAALKGLTEARLYNQFLSGYPGMEENPMMGGLNQGQFQRSDISQGFPTETGAAPIQETRKTIPKQEVKPEKVKIAGVEFDRSELPEKKKTIPPFGPLAKASEIQESQRKENRKEVNKFIAPYQDVNNLQAQKNKLLEAERIIEKEDLGGVARNIISGILEGKDEEALSQYLKTPAAHKLYSLLYDSIRSKELGGSNPSTREVMFSMARLPSGLKGKEANKYIIKRMIEEADRNLEKGKTIQAALKYDKNMDIDDLRELISKKAPSSVNVDEDKRSIAEKLMDESGNDPVKARQLAKERGIEF